MINFKITGLESGFLSIEKPSGKAIALKLGEVVKADIMDILPTGDAVLRIKGETITAKAEVLLNKDSAAYFKVAGQPEEGKDLRLQFMGYADAPDEGGLRVDFKGDALQKLIQEFQSLKTAGQPPKSETIETLIKTLPPDIGSLPKDIKVQIQELLTASLKSTGQSIQTRLGSLFDQLPEAVRSQPLIENLKKELLVSAERLLGASLKNALQNTGVVLETKLRSALASLLFREIGQGTDTETTESADTLNAAPGTPRPEPSGEEGPLLKADGRADIPGVKTSAPPLSPGHEERDEAAGVKSDPASAGKLQPEHKAPREGGIHPEISSLKSDLKASLLELKQVILEHGKDTSVKPQAGQGAHDSTPVRVLQGTIEHLLRDIETFQALSKTTDSFYTFLPLSWKELQDGEISFKRGPGNAEGKSSYSCRINLDLEEFGKLSITVLMYNRDFFVSFRPERSDFKAALDAELDALRNAFTEKGLSLKAVHTLDRGDASFEQLEKLGPSERIINITA